MASLGDLFKQVAQNLGYETEDPNELTLGQMPWLRPPGAQPLPPPMAQMEAPALMNPPAAPTETISSNAPALPPTGAIWSPSEQEKAAFAAEAAPRPGEEGLWGWVQRAHRVANAPIPGANPEVPTGMAGLEGVMLTEVAPGLLGRTAGGGMETLKAPGSRPRESAIVSEPVTAPPSFLPRRSRAVSSVRLREKPPRIPGSGANGQVTKEDVAAYTANPDISDRPFNEQVQIMTKRALEEIRYQQKQRRSGEGWYRDDVREMEHAATQAFPELKDPELMGFFKALAATTSFGNKPKENLEIAFNIYEKFRETGELPAQQVSGANWPGSPGFGTPPPRAGELATSRAKLLKLKEHTGDWRGVVRWLGEEHPVGEMRALGFKVSGKASEMKPGAFALGPKGGPFYRNLSGFLDDLTGDMWVSRTMNRLRGTPFNKDGTLPDAPRNDQERRLFRAVSEKVAGELGVATADAQAMHWFHEKDLWGKLMGGEDFGTYSVAGRRALESLQQKRAEGLVGLAASQIPTERQKVGFEITFGENAPFRKKYDWGSLTPEAQRSITDDHARWLAEEVALETGVEIEAVVGGTGPSNWGNNPNAVVRLRGTPKQIRSAARLIGLGAQQDAVAITRENPQGNTPGIDVIRRGPGSRNWDRSFLDAVREKFDSRAGGVADHSAIEINVSANNEPMLKVYGIDDVGTQYLNDAKHRARAQKILRDIVAELDPNADPLARKGTYDLVFEGNDWEVSPNGEGYRQGLEAAGHSPVGLDSFQSRVAAALDAAWGRHAGRPEAQAPAGQAVAPSTQTGPTLGEMAQGVGP